MTTDERFKQLEDVMVEMLRKQDRTVEELAHLREGQSELNTKVVRIENRIERMDNRLDRVDKRLERVEGKFEDTARNLLELRRDVEKFQQLMITGMAQIVQLIGDKK